MRRAVARPPSVGLFVGRPDRGFFLQRKLRERGLEVVHYNVQGYGDDPWVPVKPGFLRGVARLLRTDHDVYLASLCFAPALSVYVNRLLQRRPYVFNATGAVWETYEDRARSKPCPAFTRHVYAFLLARVLAGASRIVCNSRFLAREVARRYPRHRDRVLAIYNGIDAERYATGRREPIPGVGATDPTCLFVTTLNFGNKASGLDLVVDAFGDVCRTRRDAKLVVAAKVSHRQYAEAAERYLRSKPWAASVVVFYNHPRVPDLLASSDVFVFATPANSNDSLPRALLEAQAAGLPAVTTDTVGCPEVVADGESGLVVPYSAPAIGQAVLRLLEDHPLRRRWGEAGRERVRRLFSWDAMADRYATVFRELAI